MTSVGTDTGSADKASRRAALPQTDVPSTTLDETLRVARAIANELGKQPATPLQVAAAMGVAPTTGHFRTITAASMAYGLTEGGAYAEKIALTELGRRIVAPVSEGDDFAAKREAVLRPRVTHEFLRKYDGSKWPRDDIGRNVLEAMGVPAEQAARALELIRRDADDLHLITTINGADFVSLDSAGVGASPPSPNPPISDDQPRINPEPESSHDREEGPLPVQGGMSRSGQPSNRRVFITHGKNQTIVGQIKKLLTFGDFVPVVAQENQTTAKPVPDKVMDEMRSCSAGIVHVGEEMRLIDADGQEHQMINPNVLIEIGAAMALYGRRFILLVERGVALPSNLQGLYEVRYEGAGLDHESTMALLEAFNSFKEVQNQ